MPLLTVTHRCSPLLIVTHRYSPLLTVTQASKKKQLQQVASYESQIFELRAEMEEVRRYIPLHAIP